MFVFSVFETVFMVGMALNFFYSWQSYSSTVQEGEVMPEVVAIPLRQVADLILQNAQARWRHFISSGPIATTLNLVQPILKRLEQMTGRGGQLTNGFQCEMALQNEYSPLESKEESDDL